MSQYTVYMWLISISTLNIFYEFDFTLIFDQTLKEENAQDVVHLKDEAVIFIKSYIN